MYGLFNQTRNYGSYIVPAGFDNVSTRIADDVLKVKTYYRSSNLTAKNDHLLVNLINTMAVPLSYDIEQYYDTASMRALAVATNLQLTSSVSKGVWFNGVFYNGSKEIIFAIVGEDDPKALEQNWRELHAVRVLDHPVSNLGYMLPNGLENNSETGYAYIEIDVPKLMLQYRSFYYDQKYRQLLDGNHPIASVGQFVARYVIPNMLDSQTDLAIVNRLINLFNGAPMGAALRRHPIVVGDQTDGVDRIAIEVLKRITDARSEYGVILRQLPLVFSNAPFKMPDIAETVQVWWALYAARMKMMMFLYDVSGEVGQHFNQAAINQMKIELKRFKSDNVFKRNLPQELQDDFNYFAWNLK